MPRYFHERGRNHEEALEKIRRKYGESARILMQKTVPGPGVLGLFGREQVEYSGYVATGNEARTVQQNRDRESRKAILMAAGKEPVSVTPEASAKSDGDVGRILEEIRDMKEQLALGVQPPPAEPYPVLAELREILMSNDFEDAYVNRLFDTLRRSFRAAELEDRDAVHQEASALIAGSLGFFEAPSPAAPRVFILAGPTGVGKTTTIAKLAAVHGLSGEDMDVRILTVDSFRIGARAQVETYGQIMGIPVTAVDDYENLKLQVTLASEADLILVDTIGKSPKDADKIEQMRHLLSACGEKAEIHLTLSATTKTSDLRDVMKQFQSFGYQSVVITKLDETSRVGGLISVVAESGIPLSFITDGQSVPVDIAAASPARLLSMIRGLDYDGDAMEERYPVADLTAAWR